MSFFKIYEIFMFFVGWIEEIELVVGDLVEVG